MHGLIQVNPRDTKYLKGVLPATSIIQSPLFSNVGFDYAGPFLFNDRQTRGAKLIKAYVCLFLYLG